MVFCIGTFIKAADMHDIKIFVMVIFFKTGKELPAFRCSSAVPGIAQRAKTGADAGE